MKKLLFLFLAPLFLAGCSGIALPEDKKNYIGMWESNNMTLKISDTGYVNYTRQENGMSKSVDAPIQSFENEDFTVGIWMFKTTFDVQKEPFEENGQWKMVVDGELLIRTKFFGEEENFLPKNSSFSDIEQQLDDAIAQGKSDLEKDIKNLDAKEAEANKKAQQEMLAKVQQTYKMNGGKYSFGVSQDSSVVKITGPLESERKEVEGVELDIFSGKDAIGILRIKSIQKSEKTVSQETFNQEFLRVIDEWKEMGVEIVDTSPFYHGAMSMLGQKFSDADAYAWHAKISASGNKIESRIIFFESADNMFFLTLFSPEQETLPDDAEKVMNVFVDVMGTLQEK